MKNLLKFSFILIAAFSLFSCSNDNTDVIPEEQSAEVNVALKTSLTSYARNATSTNQAEDVFDNNEDSNGDCFTIDFPYALTDGQTQTVINNEDELNAYMQSVVGGNPSGGGVEPPIIDFVFPVTVTLEDGTTVTVADHMGFIALIEDCIGDDVVVGDECFTFNFPITVETIDGNTVVVNDELELYSVPDAIGFVFPISVTTANGVVTINDDADFDALYNDCYDIEPCDDCGTNCFEIVFPITLVDDSGNITTVNDDDEFFAYLDGLGNDTFFTITYPMNIEYEDGTQATINSDEELDAAFDECD